MTRRLMFVMFVMLLARPIDAEEELFSGPQVGERLAPFQTRRASGDKADATFDLVADADGGPLLIVFVHNVTRPSIGLTRTAIEYARRKWPDSLTAGIVFLSADATATASWLKRASHAIPDNVPVGISVDGLEGPGAYGLNRNATLTVLVAKGNAVTANFALVQPSLGVDAPKIGKALVEVMGGGQAPTLEQMGATAGRMGDVRFRALLSPVIKKEASPDQVTAAATKVEEIAAKNKAFRNRLGQSTRRIVNSGRLTDYGTPQAQAYIKKWAEEYP